MPHYSDGTLAAVGDVVRGKGYNIKDESGELAEIVGVITTVTPGAETCNVSLIVPKGCIPGTTSIVLDGVCRSGAIVEGSLEYGQADHFVKV